MDDDGRLVSHHCRRGRMRSSIRWGGLPTRTTARSVPMDSICTQILPPLVTTSLASPVAKVWSFFVLFVRTAHRDVGLHFQILHADVRVPVFKVREEFSEVVKKAGAADIDGDLAIRKFGQHGDVGRDDTAELRNLDLVGTLER